MFRSVFVLAGSLLIGWSAPAAIARIPDPIPPQAVWMSDDRALALLPETLKHRPGLQVVLHLSLIHISEPTRPY